MQPKATMEPGVMVQRDWLAPRQVPRLARLLGKFVLDVLPGALASVIGGVLFSQYQFGHQLPPRPPAGQTELASAEMMAMVRDEHAAIMNYLDSQIAAERSRDVAAADARTADEAVAANAAPPRGTATTAVKTTHGKAPAVVPSAHAPLMIVQTQYRDGAVAPADRLASDPASLLAKTLVIKDHVVAATRNVVAVIGNVFASVGERIGSALPGGRQFAS